MQVYILIDDIFRWELMLPLLFPIEKYISVKMSENGVHLKDTFRDKLSLI